MDNGYKKKADGKVEVIDFIFKSYLSLRPLINFWESATVEKEKMKSAFAETVLHKLDQIPELNKPIEDWKLIDQNKDMVDMLMSIIYPASQWNKLIAASFAPFQFKKFYGTEFFEKKLNFDTEAISQREDFKKSSSGFARTMKGYHIILHKCYGLDFNTDYSTIFDVYNNETDLVKYYQLEYDIKFLNVNIIGDKPELTKDDVEKLLSAPTNAGLWIEKLPPEKFEFEGFVTIRGVDVTRQQILSRLKHELLEKDVLVSDEAFLSLQNLLRSYFDCPQLKIGMVSMMYRKDLMKYGKQVVYSFVLDKECGLACDDLHNSIYEKAFTDKKPVVIENIESFDKKTKVEEEILRKGIKNLIVAPLLDGEEVIGVLEIGSPCPRSLTTYDLFFLKEILSLFSTFLKRSNEEFENKIEAIVKEEFTVMHPSVEWRFVDAALNLFEERKENKSAEIEPIVFDDVYPLYGVSDIRNSSDYRNESIQHDLIAHLDLVDNLLDAALKKRNLPIVDEMRYRVNKYKRSIKKGLNSGDEVTVLEFLHTEVDKLLNHFKSEIPEMDDSIDDYYSKLDPTLRSFYDKRKEYEDSVSAINDCISSYLDEAEKEAQKMFPHYFEKYKTDGVEHGLYIGASLVKDRQYDEMYLKNLRLWQLLTICEIAKRTNDLLPELSVPLETTHLILVQNAPLSIRFRIDEKKFDVDGTYNIRYEIMKKRIDKAIISGTSERLTQPGKIAIVYSQQKEADEYLKYIDYLKGKEIIKKEVERIDLEEMQGVQGLKALRITVNLEREILGTSLGKNSVEEILQSVTKNVN